MAGKSGVKALTTSAQTLATGLSGQEWSVYGLIFVNESGTARTVTVGVYDQSTATKTTFNLPVPANSAVTFPKPVTLTPGDYVDVLADAASAVKAVFTYDADTGASPIATGFSPKGVWSSETAYVANDVVSRGGYGYTAIQSGTNQDPLTASAYWLQIIDGTVVSSAVTSAVTGKQSMWITAAAMRARSTNGAGYTTSEGATNKSNWFTFDFDPTTQEFVQFDYKLPKMWNGGTITFVPVWRHPATTTNFGVVWRLSAVGLSDSDATDAVQGTGQTSTDTGGVTGNLYVGPESSAITISSVAAGDVILFELSRLPANVSDTMAVDANLIGIEIFITTNAANDS